MRALSICAVVLLALPAAADTWIVDDDGGPGVDFTDLQAAINAARNGDVLLVLNGTYGAITIDQKRLTVVGEDSTGTLVSGSSEIRDTTFQRVNVSTLWFEEHLDVTNCNGAVFLDGLRIGGTAFNRALDVSDSRDVRIVASELKGGLDAHAVIVTDSRVELTRCTVRGGNGRDEVDFSFGPGPGGNAVVLTSAAKVHAAGSRLDGGFGGSSGCLPQLGYGADGGDALVVQPATEAIVTGRPTDTITGGGGGSGCLFDGLDGHAVFNQGALRWSGATVGPSFGLPAETTPADPVLELLGSPATGSFDPVLRVHGNPGDFVRLFLGRTPILGPPDGPAIESLLVKLRTVNLGFVPASGYVDYSFPQLGFFPPGTAFVAQAGATSTLGVLQRTNSVPIVVRQ